jgi:hypothetical protein
MQLTIPTKAAAEARVFKNVWDVAGPVIGKLPAGR